MSQVERHTIVDFATYEDTRAATRAATMEIKKPRRIHVGPYLTFLFENVDTMRYQIQEMMRIERIVREADIQHEIDTYNEVLGGPGELGCTLMIEIDDEGERDIKLRRWLGLPEKLYMTLEDGSRVGATYDERQVGTDRVSSVQYLKFNTGGKIPVALGCALDDPDVGVEAKLSPEQVQALTADLN